MYTVLVTGATDGIGKQTSLELLNLGFHVILHGRNPKKMGNVVKELRRNSLEGTIDTVMGDFSSFSSIYQMEKDLRKKYDKIDVLVNNAGLFMNERVLTDDGIETVFQVNHLAPFLLTSRLIDLVAKSDYARIVNVSSTIHASSIDLDNLQSEKSFDKMASYCMTKLCNLFFTYRLARLLENTHLTVNALHPGYINTNIDPSDSGGAPVSQGSLSSMHLITSPDMRGKSGLYFMNNAKQAKSKDISYDTDLQDKIWEISEDLIGEKFREIPQ